MTKWILLAVLIAAFVATSMWISPKTDEHDHEQESFEPANQPQPKASTPKVATMTPGRVVELQTTRGTISFILFEKDCPLTTKRIADLVAKGAYNGVSFPRVEDWVIQTDDAKIAVKPMGLEVMTGLANGKGAVGMARTQDPNSNTNIFYILLDPQPSLDLQYTVFGRVTKGMDVAMKIKKGDVIKSATLRPLTDQDKADLNRVRTIEGERKTQ